jgi:hypothetical protein
MNMNGAGSGIRGFDRLVDDLLRRYRQVLGLAGDMNGAGHGAVDHGFALLHCHSHSPFKFRLPILPGLSLSVSNEPQNAYLKARWKKNPKNPNRFVPQMEFLFFCWKQIFLKNKV